MRQDDIILEALKKGESLTQLDALRRYGVGRLAAVVHRLRESHNIHSEPVVVQNRFGRDCRVAKYTYIAVSDFKFPTSESA